MVIVPVLERLKRRCCCCYEISLLMEKGVCGCMLWLGLVIGCDYFLHQQKCLMKEPAKWMLKCLVQGGSSSYENVVTWEGRSRQRQNCHGNDRNGVVAVLGVSWKFISLRLCEGNGVAFPIVSPCLLPPTSPSAGLWGSAWPLWGWQLCVSCLVWTVQPGWHGRTSAVKIFTLGQFCTSSYLGHLASTVSLGRCKKGESKQCTAEIYLVVHRLLSVMVKVGLEPAEMMMWTVTMGLVSLRFHDITSLPMVWAGSSPWCPGTQTVHLKTRTMVVVGFWFCIFLQFLFLSCVVCFYSFKMRSPAKLKCWWHLYWDEKRLRRYFYNSSRWWAGEEVHTGCSRGR